MTITLTPDLEEFVNQKARDRATTPEAVVLDAIREQLDLQHATPRKTMEPCDDWERRLLGVGTPCGVAIANEALSSEGLYE